MVRGLYSAFLIRRRSIVTALKPCSLEIGGKPSGGELGAGGEAGGEPDRFAGTRLPLAGLTEDSTERSTEDSTEDSLLDFFFAMVA